MTRDEVLDALIDGCQDAMTSHASTRGEWWCDNVTGEPVLPIVYCGTGRRQLSVRRADIVAHFHVEPFEHVWKWVGAYRNGFRVIGPSRHYASTREC